MTIEKLKSGNYRITQMIDGKRYRLTVNHKPTQNEALKLISDVIDNKPLCELPLVSACEAYIETKSNLLSASTIRGYKGIIRQISPSVSRLKISEINKPILQTEINNYSLNHAPKTVKNFGAFLLSVLEFYGNEIRGITFPQPKKKEPYIPTIDEVKKVLNRAKGTKYEVPFMLATMGLRRSEICALGPDDLEGNVLHITKAKVQGADGKWSIKTTKTTDSTRSIVLPDYLVDIIKDRGFYTGYPNFLYVTLTKYQDELGIPHFSLHKLRHFCMSYLHDLGYSDKQIQEIGGYRSNNVLNQVYKHAMNMSEAKEKISNDFTRIFDT